ncbi:MAG: TonB-dependent receptor [Sphingomonas sp.]|nr:TonB-dependent receptor [Sphingomonas sp.]
MYRFLLSQTHTRLLLSCCALAVAAGIATPALAQDASVSTNQDGSRIDEIVVTAQHREQTEQDVPAALTVIGGDQLENRNIQTVSDLENSVPSLEIDQQFGGGQPQFRMRGVGGTDYAANNTNTVGVYLDEVPLTYGVMTQDVMFDIDRIEVLRGPQGTLYGRNTTGGAVNIVTGAPSHEFHAGVGVSYGSFDAFDLQGYVTGGLSDTLSARLSVMTAQGGAWQVNRDTGEELGDRNQNAARVRLRWDLSAATRIDFEGDYSRNKSDGRGLQLLQDFTDASGRFYPADTDHRITGWGISSEFASLIGASPNAKPFRDNTGYGGSIHLTSDFGWSTLTAIAAHRHFERREFNDWDGTASNEAGTFFFNDIDIDSAEIRLASPQSGATRWLLGTYYAAESVDGGFYSDFSDYPSLGNIWKTSYQQRVHTLAGFVNLEQDLTPSLTLSGGVRFEHEIRRLNNFRSEILWPTYTLRASADPRREMNEWSGKVALDWQVAQDAHAYASISRGVKSGGFTTYNSGIPQQLDPYDPEWLIAYEVGVKSEFLDNRLRVNAAGFYYDYHDYQLQGVIYTGANTRVGRIVNVPRANIWGGELEITAVPVDGLQISQSVAYKIGHFDEFMAPSTAVTDPVTGETTITYVDRAGERLPLPGLDYKGAISWRLPIANWAVTPEINWNRRGDRYSTSDLSVIPAFWLANANLTISPPDERFQIALYVHNLFDAYVQETRNRFISARTVSTNPVRTVGIRLNYVY